MEMNGKKILHKKRAVLFTLLSVVLAAAILFGTMLLSGAAGADLSASRNEENEEYLSIIAHNVEYGEYMHLYYALDLNLPEGARAEDVRMLFWNAPQESYDKDNENILYSVSGKLGDKIEMGNEVYDSPYLFRSKGIAPKEIGDTIYARAYVTDSEGNTYYSRVDKFGVLQYVHAMYRTKELGYTVTDDQMHLYDTIVRYGASAQKIFNYKTDRLVSDHTVRIEAVNGVGADGFSTGIYFVGDTVTLTANEAPEGQAFFRWVNKAGETVSEKKSFTFKVTEDTKSEVYVAVSGNLCSDGHTAGYAVIEDRVEPTCTKDGSYDSVVYCSVCYTELSREKVVVPALEHSPSESVEENRIDATCTKDGSYDSVVYCSVCGLEISRETVVLPTEPHSPSNEVEENRIQATCAKDGSYDSVVYCSVCNEELSRTSNIIESTGNHNVVNGYCTVCGEEIGSAGLTYELQSDDTYYITGYTGTDTDVIIPEKHLGKNVTRIDSYAFQNCYNITSVTIPNSVTSIGEKAFYSCDSLTSVTIPDSVTIMGAAAFRVCSNLTSVTIGDGVTSIGSYTFYNCRRLTNVTIGDSVASISSSAFFGCYKLVEVINKSSLNIVAGSRDYGEVAYYAKVVHNGESKIVNYEDYLFITGDNANYLLGYVGNDTDIALPDDYNGENYEIYKYAFYNCTSLTSVIIPDSVTSIGSSAFYNCYRLTSVKIGDRVTSIGSQAFYSCGSLTSVTIPDSVTSLGSSAFKGCDSLTIYCVVGSQPVGWSSSWNDSGCPVVWGYTADAE